MLTFVLYTDHEHINKRQASCRSTALVPAITGLFPILVSNLDPRQRSAVESRSVQEAFPPCSGHTCADASLPARSQCTPIPPSTVALRGWCLPHWVLFTPSTHRPSDGSTPACDGKHYTMEPCNGTHPSLLSFEIQFSQHQTWKHV